MSVACKKAGIFEDFSHRQLEGKGAPRAVLLCGNLTNLLTNEGMASKKFDNFKMYEKINPEFHYLFVGDSGQGDVILGERMLATDAVDGWTRRVALILIHDVRYLLTYLPISLPTPLPY